MDDFTKFLEAQKSLDATVTRIDRRLIGAADIHEALKALVAFKFDLETQPRTFADLVAEKAKVDARLPRREADARKAKHVIAPIETKLKKLGESLVYNSNLAATPEAAPVMPVTLSLGVKLPASRQERIDQLKQEIATVEATLADPSALHKKAVKLYKSDVTRANNLARKLAETGQLMEMNRSRLPEMTKLAKKTANHLAHRQAHRERKAAEYLAKPGSDATATIPDFENADGSPAECEDVWLEPLPPSKTAPTDEQLRRKAERFFGQSVSDEQLAELRSDPEFLNL